MPSIRLHSISLDDVVTISADGKVLFGDDNVAGTYKIQRNGDNLVTYRYESSAYAVKQKVKA